MLCNKNKPTHCFYKLNNIGKKGFKYVIDSKYPHFENRIFKISSKYGLFLKCQVTCAKFNELKLNPWIYVEQTNTYTETLIFIYIDYRLCWEILYIRLFLYVCK